MNNDGCHDRRAAARILLRVAFVLAVWIAAVAAIQALLNAQRRSAEAAAPVLRALEETEAAEREELDRLFAAPPESPEPKARLAAPTLFFGGYCA